MPRVKFKKTEQRKFLKEVLEKINCPSLRAFDQFGMDVPYSTMKNYFTEKRNLPESFFRDLCYLAKIDSDKLDVEILGENYGQVVGGKKSSRAKSR